MIRLLEKRLRTLFCILWVFAPFSAVSLAAEPVGKVELTSGSAVVTRSKQDIPLRTNDPIFQDDELATGAASKLVVLFIDGTRASLGENADLVIDAFAYAPADPNNNAALRIATGAARFVAGAMERANRENALKITTKVATIGIRGTDFFVETDGQRLAVALFSGYRVEVANAAGTTVLQPGEGTDVTGASAPTTAKVWAPERINRALVLTSFTPMRERPLPYVRGPAKGNTFADALTAGVVSVDMRVRTESVDSAAFPRTGEATTARLRIGYETMAINGFYAGISGQVTRNLARPVRNDGLNRRIDLPLILDPSAETLHEGYLGWIDRGEDGLVRTKIVAGRQRLQYENERWIGPSEFRQNAQSFDAVSASTSVLPQLTLRYAYLWQIIRPLGGSGINWDSNSHLLGAATNVLPYGVTTAYGYVLDLKQAQLLSSATYGIRYEGSVPLSASAGSSLAFTLEAEFARQTDHAKNPNSYALSYNLIRPGITWNGTTLMAGWERVGGNGVSAVQTPLATLHRQNGWADVFTVTPPNGLRDLHIRLIQALPDVGPFKLPKLDVRFHDFASAGGPGGRRHYGHEWDADINANVAKNFALGFRAARYDAASFGADTTKVWGYLEFHY